MRSVQRILAVFESFSTNRTSLTLQEIADRIELPKSTAFRIVQSIEQAGYLVRLDDQRYCLSIPLHPARWSRQEHARHSRDRPADCECACAEHERDGDPADDQRR